jgi:ligand-binding sensor protein
MAEFLNKFLGEAQEKMCQIFGMKVSVCKVVDKEGNILLRLDTLPEICKMIMETKEGMAGCNASCGATNALVKEKDAPVFITCHAGFMGFYFPIVIEGEKLGGITGCLAMVPEFSEEKIKERCEELAKKYGLDEKRLERVFRQDFKAVSAREKENYLNLLKNTLQEVFDAYGIELKESLKK